MEEPLLAYEELLKEFEGLSPYDSLVKFIVDYRNLEKKYLLGDLMAFMRKLKGELRDEDIYRFYEEHPELKLDFISIASLLISWIPPPPVESGELRLPLDGDVWKTIRREGLGLGSVGAFWVYPDGYVLLKFKPGIKEDVIQRVTSAVRELGYNVRIRREVVRFW